MRRIRRGDLVEVVSGKYKGKRGRVQRVLVAEDKVVVEGVAMIKRHTKPTPRKPQGGIVEREAPIWACKVMPIDPGTGKPTRVRFRTSEDGEKVRVGKSGQEIRAAE